MPETLNLSQPAWALLDMLQQELGVSLEVLDSAMRPLGPAGGEPASAIEQPAVAAEAARSLKSGDVRIERASGEPVGIFPLRAARRIAGVLIVARRRADAAEAPAGPESSVERAGHLARTAIESDLGLTGQLSEARYRTRRAHGVLRFLAQLGTFDGDREVMHAVIQAATVWFDVDCRIYERQSDGSFRVAATLPGAEARAAVALIDGARAEKLVTTRRFATGGDLDDLGLGGRREVLVLPVGGASPEWLLILAGAVDPEVELTFTAIARVLAGQLQARELSRIDRWQQRLSAIADEKRRAPERVLLTLLESLAAETGAVAARVTLDARGTERALAALGPGATAPSDPEAPQSAPEVGEHTAALELTPGTVVRVSLGLPAAVPSADAEIAGWLKALHPWLYEAVLSLTSQATLFDTAVEISSFERRIQEEIERARRFDLGLGLVLIGGVDTLPGDPGMEAIVGAVRSELRASDLMGRIRGGQVAVLLVHAESTGAESVVGRLRRRLHALGEETTVPVVELGRAVFSADCRSADALIARALTQAQRLEIRN